jgi:hypothetical protein
MSYIVILHTFAIQNGGDKTTFLMSQFVKQLGATCIIPNNDT